MTTSNQNLQQINFPSILKLNFTDASMEVFLDDGRILSIPLAWYHSLANATRQQLDNHEISPGGYGVHWPGLDEDLSVKGFLLPQ